jgi:NADH-quinone oxidoreductase subunit C
MNPLEPTPPPKSPTPETPQPVAVPPATPILLPPSAAELLARCVLPFQAVEYSLKGYHLEVNVIPENIVDVTAELDREGFALDTITGVDWLAQNQIELVYDFFHPLNGVRAVMRTRIAREDPEVCTISGLFPGAAWHERETHDFFGVRFSGHANLAPFLLPEDATYHPLRKDFAA